VSRCNDRDWGEKALKKFEPDKVFFGFTKSITIWWHHHSKNILLICRQVLFCNWPQCILKARSIRHNLHILRFYPLNNSSLHDCEFLVLNSIVIILIFLLRYRGLFSTFFQPGPNRHKPYCGIWSLDFHSLPFLFITKNLLSLYKHNLT